MITSFNVPIWSQRDPRWQGQRLGTVNGATIGQFGCLITDISMMNAGFDPGNPLTPNQVDDLFTNNKGYANGDLVVWNAINRLLPNCALMGQDFCANSPAPIDKIKHHLDIGGLCIVQVGFGGNPANMHYLLVVGYGAGPIFNDPWYGDQSNFESRRYGTGDASKDILAVHYFGDAIANTPVKAEVPVAPRPAEQPLLGFQRTVRPGVNVNYRQEPNEGSPALKLFKAGEVLDFKGFVRGENIDGNDIWFVGKYTGGYAFSGAFTDTATHDLDNLTPQPQTPEPAKVVEETSNTTTEATPVAVTVVPDYQTSYREKAEKNREVVPAGGTDVIDVSTGQLVHHLNQGDVIKFIAGYFVHNNTEYARTTYAASKGLWNGVKSVDLGPPEVEIPIKPATPEELEESFKDLAKQGVSLGEHLKEIVAILLSPLLKLIGRKN